MVVVLHFEKSGDVMFVVLMAFHLDLQGLVGSLLDLLHAKCKGFLNEMILRKSVGFSV